MERFWSFEKVKIKNLKLNNFLLLFLFSICSFAQETEKDTIQELYIFEGDTVAVPSIGLDEVVLLNELKFKDREERIRYLILKRKTRKVYPYAKLAAERLVELNSRLAQLESKRDRRRYTKIIENYIEDQFAAELKKLTHTEGQILVKLIHRQTGITTFELIKELKSGWRAFWYNTTASLFEISLKEKYDPENVHEDYYIEDILQRSFNAGVLERQPTALNFKFLELENKWK